MYCQRRTSGDIYRRTRGQVLWDKIIVGGKKQRSFLDVSRAVVSVRSAQFQLACASFGEAARTTDYACINAVAVLIEHNRRIVDDVARKARGIAHQSAAIDRRGAGVVIGSGQGKCAGSLFRQTSRAVDVTGKCRTTVVAPGDNRRS